MCLESPDLRAPRDSLASQEEMETQVLMASLDVQVDQDHREDLVMLVHQEQGEIVDSQESQVL